MPTPGFFAAGLPWERGEQNRESEGGVTMIRRTLKRALSKHPILFEPVPPSARTAHDKVETYVRRVAALLEAHPRVDAFVVPELVNENHNGEPMYRSGDVRRFGSQVSKESGCEAILNRVVAHSRSIPELEEWCRKTIAEGIRNVMFIGGTSRYIPYPGPSVVEANAGALSLIHEHAGLIGNVVIPHRHDEGYRMLTKTKSGASFFTTQIVFDPEPIASLIDEYGRLCRAYGVTPASVILSVAPVADEDDLEFVRWLGAEIPEKVEHALVTGDGSGSIAAAVATWRGVLEASARWEISVPLGVNVEVVSPRHFATAVELLSAFEKEIAEGGG
jgi:5,10-methylenetetrahydrofolate reductase